MRLRTAKGSESVNENITKKKEFTFAQFLKSKGL